ncbi:MAG: hypothetical protein ACOH5I_10695 [Oligoflexus sp.]
MSSYIRPLLALGLGSLLLSCGGDSDSPDTLARDKLSPPLNLVTVTGDQSVELRWSAQNFESELQGYNVYVIENKTLEEVAALGTEGFPQFPELDAAGASLKNSSIPRCQENNAFFSLLGITVESEESCTSGGSIFGFRSQDQLASVNGKMLAATTVLQEEEKVSVRQAKLTCYDPSVEENPEDAEANVLGNDNVSLPKGSGEFQDGQGIQRCLIKKTLNGEALQNGVSYTFVVFAVLGSDFSEISWSSNLVEDTPAKPVFEATVEVPASQYRTLTLGGDPIDTTAILADAVACNAETFCLVSGRNTVASGAENAIYIARDTGGYPQRLFLSVSTESKLNLLYRGPITLDPIVGSDVISSRVPEDEAISATAGGTSYLNGATIAIYDNSVIDVAYRVDAETTHYGKLVIDQISYADDSASGIASFKLTVILQSKANSTHYFHRW